MSNSICATGTLGQINLLRKPIAYSYPGCAPGLYGIIDYKLVICRYKEWKCDTI